MGETTFYLITTLWNIDCGEGGKNPGWVCAKLTGNCLTEFCCAGNCIDWFNTDVYWSGSFSLEVADEGTLYRLEFSDKI